MNEKPSGDFSPYNSETVAHEIERAIVRVRDHISQLIVSSSPLDVYRGVVGQIEETFLTPSRIINTDIWERIQKER